MSLLTSLEPSGHGVTAPVSGQMKALGGGAVPQRLPDERVTLAEALAAGGYATAAFTGGGTMPFFLFWPTFEVHQPYLHPRFVHDVVSADLAQGGRRHGAGGAAAPQRKATGPSRTGGLGRRWRA